MSENAQVITAIAAVVASIAGLVTAFSKWGPFITAWNKYASDSHKRAMAAKKSAATESPNETSVIAITRPPSRALGTLPILLTIVAFLLLLLQIFNSGPATTSSVAACCTTTATILIMAMVLLANRIMQTIYTSMEMNRDYFAAGADMGVRSLEAISTIIRSAVQREIPENKSTL